MLCLCVQCMYMWKYLACIWKVEVAWPMGSHFVEWWGSLLRRWVRRTSPHFVACHFTLRQTIRLTLSTPKLRHHHQLRCTQLYMYILLISSVQLMFCFIFHLWMYFIRFSYFQLFNLRFPANDGTVKHQRWRICKWGRNRSAGLGQIWL